MKYAIVESGGKQFKAIEGSTIEVDRLPVEIGSKVDLDRILMFVDGDQITVGKPTIPGFKVKTSVLDHIKGPKVIIFRYRPRKRIRVKSGHRQQYTRLLIEQVGTSGKSKKAVEEAISEPIKDDKPKAPVKKPTTAGDTKTSAKVKSTKKTAAKSTAAKTKTTSKPASAKPKTTSKTTSSKAKNASKKSTTNTKSTTKPTASKTKSPSKTESKSKPSTMSSQKKTTSKPKTSKEN